MCKILQDKAVSDTLQMFTWAKYLGHVRSDLCLLAHLKGWVSMLLPGQMKKGWDREGLWVELLVDITLEVSLLCTEKK